MIRTRFHPHCNRVENGVQTTNNAGFPLPIAKLGCEEQFALGWYLYDDELRARAAGDVGSENVVRVVQIRNDQVELGKIIRQILRQRAVACEKSGERAGNGLT